MSVNVDEYWNMLMYRYHKAEKYFARTDISEQEKLEWEPNLHKLLDEISAESIKRSLMQNQMTLFRGK